MIWYDGNLKNVSRILRKNMTEAERLLWSKLRGKQLKGYQFYRQKTLGNYIVDFFCPKAKLAVELDGSQHYTQEGVDKDLIRDAYLHSCGLIVLRFTNSEVVVDIDSVLGRIYEKLP